MKSYLEIQYGTKEEASFSVTFSITANLRKTAN